MKAFTSKFNQNDKPKLCFNLKKKFSFKGSFKKVIKNTKTTPTIKTDRNSKN
ncbi:hypothetical protein HPNQ4053_0476 [Helicobacter pylori NQ4053]|uniref:Uncharacterized protein n=1 Tax=Helicobacter pylori NQ4053 TaxID=992027 RepID=J0JA06_HELPX|nr:hypothetical protein HPNQ4053_0476 [Helicobacter pylori NQ4053]